MNDHLAQVVTFSGIDGAGKTTQIDLVAAHLAQVGYRVARVTFWDDVAVLPKLRAGVSLRKLRTKRSPAQPEALRSDKNIRAWYLTMVRAVFYLLDALSLRRVVARLRTEDRDYIIFDRYVYDQLVQIRARHWGARLYIRGLLAISPEPDVALILDASPDAAFLRKPEYPLAFMHDYRHAFLNLRAFVPELTVIAPAAVEDVHQRVLACLLTEPERSGDHRSIAASSDDSLLRDPR